MSDTKPERPWAFIFQSNCEELERAAVPGGWIYRSSQRGDEWGSESMVFVQNPSCADCIDSPAVPA